MSTAGQERFSGGLCLTQGSPSIGTVACTLLGCGGAVLCTAVSLVPTHQMPGAPSQQRQQNDLQILPDVPWGQNWPR